jgi:hypothetical protein
MALLPAHRQPKPTFQPIVRHEPLTDAEKAALQADVRLQAYPANEFLTCRQMAFCAFVRWQFPNGDDA